MTSERSLAGRSQVGPRLLLPLAALVTLALVGCVGRQASPRGKALHQGGGDALHNLNRGRVGSHASSDEHHD
jgi:hypothetical protein